MRLRIIGGIAVLVALAAAALTWSNWENIAIATAPQKLAATTRNESAKQADQLFWQTFHAGEYAGIQHALEVLTAEYLKTPNDAVTASHVAWLHTWRVAESARAGAVPATITDNIVLARKYFHEAVALNPSEARYLGFLASMTLAEGNIGHDERETRRGYFLMLKAIHAWPEFNLFTGGYVMSALPANSGDFKQGLQWEWQDIDTCVGGIVDRIHPDFAKYMKLATKTGPKRACWNSWIAPHNFEGFFLNMGDMLVKSGDPKTARVIYTDVKLSPDYASWKFHDVLDARIQNADVNVAAFNASPSAGKTPVMEQSAFSCSACHQQ